MENDARQIIAVDAALLLPDEARERAVVLNSLLYSERSDNFLFGPAVVPHITLAQLFVRRSNLLALIETLDRTLREAAPLPLSVTKLSARGNTISLRVSRTPALFRLHARLMDEVKNLTESTGDMESFSANGEPARPQDVEWVAGFRRRAGYNRYVPHITIGYGSPPAPDVFMDFTASEAALFRLGRFCTCRELLHRWQLH